MGGSYVLSTAREVQLPLLALLLIGGCAAKARRAVLTRSIDAGADPTAMFPLRLRRPAAIAVCAAELALGVGLPLTAGDLGAGPPALAVRSATALLFLIAVGALHELRARRPQAGCGCFGELSGTPVGWRTLARAGLLCAAAVATLGVPPLRMPGSAGQAALLLAAGTAELAVLAALSPEVGEIMERLGHREPCEVRRVPLERTMAALHASAAWRRWLPRLLATEPADIWREECWRFVAFPGQIASRRYDVVFAVHLSGRHVPVRVGALETAPRIPAPRIPRISAPLHLSKHV